MRTILLLVVVPLVMLAAACGDDGGVPQREWILERESSAPIEVTLPAHMDVPDRPLTYTLRRQIPIPPAWRERRLQLVVPGGFARVSLLADGRAVPLSSESVDPEGYRAGGPHVWVLPAGQAPDSAIDVVMVVAHRWTPSAWWPAYPELRTLGDLGARASFVRAINHLVAIVAIALLLQLFVTSITVYLMERRQRAYLWFAVQVGTATIYPACVLGWTEGVGAGYEGRLLCVALSSTLHASLWFTHEFFALGPPWRGFTWSWLVTCVALSLGGGPFAVTQIGVPLVVVIAAAIVGYQAWRYIRLALHDLDRGSAVIALFGWLILSGTCLFDGAAWLGLADLLGGARLITAGLLLYGISLALLFSRRHILALRQRDTLNNELAERRRADVGRLEDELRRQLADRSAQIFAALALADGEAREALPLESGQVVQDRYRVVRELGRGGMGIVYEVVRTSDGERLALKLTSEFNGTALARLAREALAATKVNHPNVVRVVDVDVSTSGFLYIVMELVDGQSLRELIAHRADRRWVLIVLAQVARGLGALHAAGVVHRDLKPANVLVTVDADGQPHARIADFGVARHGVDPSSGSLDTREGVDPSSGSLDTREVVDPSSGSLDTREVVGFSEVRQPSADQSVGARPPAALADPAAATRELEATRMVGAIAGTGAPQQPLDPREPTKATSDGSQPKPARGKNRPVVTGPDLTRTGLVVGTPAYLAPELVGVNRQLSLAVDVYAFGVMAFELLVGRRPFLEPVAMVLLQGRPPPKPASLAAAWRDAPAEIVALIERCLAFAPEARPTTAQLEAVIGAVLTSRSPLGPSASAPEG